MVEHAHIQSPEGVQESVRDLDPNVLQRRASKPDTSVWVSASAGTGKTKVLTDRVLRLLLPRLDGQGNIIAGSPAHKILCLTFTKAAASEMAIHISETLAKWAVADDAVLGTSLKNLLGRLAEPHEITVARRLFADVIDVPGGLKIMTIHAFCQSTLARFPLEAGIHPNFKILEDGQSQALMSNARNQIFARAEADKASPLNAALHNIAATINEDQFLNLLGGIARERAQLDQLIDKHFDIDGLYLNLCQYLDVQPHKSVEEIEDLACSEDVIDRPVLMNIMNTLLSARGVSDQKAGRAMADFLGADEGERASHLFVYKRAFLTLQNTCRARLATKESVQKFPDIIEHMRDEAERLIALMQTVSATRAAALTRDVLLLGAEILDQYETLKTQQGVLDFDDLILKTLGLLTRERIGWVHYKLDSGLDHILIDEAQDTNPQQWQIIEGLCSEFFENTVSQDVARTIFTVGDEKQSIYSFQRASPEEFARMQHDFHEKTLAARQVWDAVPMNISFRSTQSVLRAVDSTFASVEASKGLGALPISHSAFRRGQGGSVSVWPLFESDQGDKPDLWMPVQGVEHMQSGQKKLAGHITDTIQGWLDRGEMLESKNRPIQPGDIMILVRTRSALVGHIARALKNAGIALSGLDRMILNQELVIEDLLAAAQFVLQPHDDLSLAAFLKSPLVGLSEDDLFVLAGNREGQSLYGAVRAHESLEFEAVRAYLKDLRVAAKYNTPFAFFSHILQTPCPGDARSGRCAIVKRLGADANDPIDEFLNLAHSFENSEAASLQNFVQAQQAQSIEIKREQSADHNAVRIMTIHGSKGLQAPIVILPDTTSSAQSGPSKAEKRLLWPQQTGQAFALWSPRTDMDYPHYSDAMDALNARLSEEYRRLLYVAMTRAEDHLYIGGALNKKQSPEKLDEGCWYRLMYQGLKALDDCEVLEDGSLRISNPQTGVAEDKRVQSDVPDFDGDLPAWLYRAASVEAREPQILRPSQVQDHALSPLSNSGTYRFLRGNLTHKLLQLLPEQVETKRERIARSFLKHYGGALSGEIHEDIVREILNILNDPIFAPLLGHESMAEVPITGHIQGRGLVSGQIDRLYVSDTHVKIIDFKTNRPPPRDVGDIPAMYKTQMEIYAAILRQIYPNRIIEAALLWTDGPFLMPLDLESHSSILD